MKRKTESKVVHTFIFDRSEISHLSLESEQWEFMEKDCREDLRKNGLPYIGGDVNWDFGDTFSSKVVMIISI